MDAPDSTAARVEAAKARGRFWDESQPGFRFASAPVGSAQFFAEVEERRYALEPHIPGVVDFERWAARDVLEVGCGIATDGVRFARAGARYVGLDGSDAALELARRRFELEGREGSFASGSAERLPFPDNSFDLTYSHGVLHHLPRPELAAAELLRVLRPGRTALVMLYHRGSLNYRFTIMGVRRALAVALLSDRGAALVAGLTGEDRGVLAGHRDLLREHGLRYLTDRQLFLSNNTDGPGNPLSEVYSRREGRRLLAQAGFEDVSTSVRYLNLRIFPGGAVIAKTRTAKLLERRIGWHLYVVARKPVAAPHRRG
jgi:SAM-dependent methyltransferase